MKKLLGLLSVGIIAVGLAGCSKTYAGEKISNQQYSEIQEYIKAAKPVYKNANGTENQSDIQKYKKVATQGLSSRVKKEVSTSINSISLHPSKNTDSFSSMSGKQSLKPAMEMATASRIGVILGHKNTVTRKELTKETKIARAVDKDFEKQ